MRLAIMLFTRDFMALLTDGDIASNYGNWHWAAGTGNDTRPGRVLSPLRQATRFDPDGDYVRRYVPELAGPDAAVIRRPWTLPAGQRRGYPAPIIENLAPGPRGTGPELRRNMFGRVHKGRENGCFMTLVRGSSQW